MPLLQGSAGLEWYRVRSRWNIDRDLRGSKEPLFHHSSTKLGTGITLLRKLPEKEMDATVAFPSYSEEANAAAAGRCSPEAIDFTIGRATGPRAE